MSRIIRLCDTR